MVDRYAPIDFNFSPDTGDKVTYRCIFVGEFEYKYEYQCVMYINNVYITSFRAVCSGYYTLESLVNSHYNNF